MEKLSGIVLGILVVAGLSLGGYLLVETLCPKVEKKPAPTIITYRHWEQTELPPRKDGETEVAYSLRCLRSDDDKVVKAICSRLKETIASPGNEFQDVIAELGGILDRNPSAITDAAASVLLDWNFDWDEKYRDNPARRLNIALYLLRTGDWSESEAAARALGGFRNIPSVDWELSPGPRDYPWREFDPEPGQYKDDIIDVKAVPRLLEAAGEASLRDVRAWSLLGAAKLDMDATVNAALKILEEDEDSTVRAAAAKVLGDSGQESVINTLLNVLKSDKADKVRTQAMHSFVRIDGGKDINMLIQLLHDPAEPMHIYRGWVTGYLGLYYSHKRLVDELDLEESTSVGIEAARGLAETGSEHTDKVLRETFESDAHPVTRLIIAHLLHKKGKPLSAEKFRKGLQEDSSEKVRMYCAWWLGELRDKNSDIDLLINALEKDENQKVRVIAAQALGKSGDTKALEPLHKALKNDADCDVRRSAAIALGMIGKTSSIKHLVEELKPKIKEMKDEKWLRNEIVLALEKIGGGEVVKPLLKALNTEPEECNREEIIRVIGRLGGEEAVEALKGILMDEWRLKDWDYAALALATHEDDEIDNMLLKALEKGWIDGVIIARAWRKGGQYIQPAEKIPCHSHYVRLIKAHWGEADKLEKFCKSLAGWHEEIPFIKVIYSQMPEGFPGYNEHAGDAQREKQAQAIEDWYNKNKDRIAWDEKNMRYYLEERNNKSD